MVPVLKQLKVWTLYVHIVVQVNHSGLGLKVERNCLRDSDLILRHSFLGTTFSLFTNGVVKFMCVFALIKPVLTPNCLNANRASQF